MNKYNFLIHNLLLIAILLGWACSSRADVDIIGKWNGKWVSDARGQSGPLVATFSKNEKGAIQAIFEGRFFKIFPFRFVVPLTIKEEKPESLILNGRMDAGDLFGTFDYIIEATNEAVEVKYSSERDHGVFSVTREQVKTKEKERRRRKRRREEAKGFKNGN